MNQYYIKNGENYEAVSEQLFTQSALDEVVGKRLERERAKYSDYDSLQSKVATFGERETELQGQIDAITSEKNDLAKQLAESKLETERSNILREFNIATDLAEFITGNSVEEMRGRAEKLAHSTQTKAVEIDKARKPEPKHSEYDEIRTGLFGSQD